MNPGPRLRTFAALVSALVLSYSALAGTGAAEAATVTVRITSTLNPVSVTVPSDTTVTFVNDDGDRHRVRTTSGPTEFDSGNLETGESFTVTLRTVGTYQYRDERNTDNAAYFGTIVVSDSVSVTTTDPTAPPPTTVAAPSAVSVSIGDRVFVPSSVTVAPGGTVTWTNNDDRPHTVTANDRSFDSGIMETGATWSRTFPSGGTFAYFCELHPDMTGTVTVQTAGGGGGPPPQPPPTTIPPTTIPPATTQPPTTPPSGGGTAPTAATVAISGNQFTPQIITIVAGGTVTWTNADAVPHTVTATTGLFDSGFLRQGDQYSQTFPTVGTFDYLCELHPEMTAKVIVVQPGSPAPATTQPPTTAPVTTHATTHSIPATTIASTPPSGGTTSLATTGSVTISGNQFSPRTITIAVGGTVDWVNQDLVPHTVTATDRSFDSGIMMQGDRWSQTFTSPGTYTYFCEIHPSMTATVVVTTPGAAAPPIVTAGSTTEVSGQVNTNSTGTNDASGTAVGAGSSGGAGSGAAQGQVAVSSVSVGMGDLQFQPTMVTVGAGGSVTWTNTDSMPHTVTADDGSFDSGIMMPGDTFTRSFAAPGNVGYRCTLHPGMNGTVQVLQAATGSTGGDTVPPAEVVEEAGVPGNQQVQPDPDQGADRAERAATLVVTVTDAGFEPADIVVHQDDTVRWEFGGVLPHTATADDGSFDSGILQPGDTFTFRFDEVGTYAYTCILHPFMTGSITVVPVDEEILGEVDGIAALSSGSGATPTGGDLLAPNSESPSAVPLLLAGLLAGLAVSIIFGFGFSIARSAAATAT